MRAAVPGVVERQEVALQVTFHCGEDGVGQRAVEDEVALDVGVAAPGEVGGGDLLRRERQGGTQARAHGALRVGRDEGEAPGVGMRTALEAASVDAGGLECAAVDFGGLVVT